jgi:hypothetical protein
VKIVGGTLNSSDLAAEGAAKLALRRLETWEEVWRAERAREFLGSVRSEGMRSGSWKKKGKDWEMVSVSLNQ